MPERGWQRLVCRLLALILTMVLAILLLPLPAYASPGWEAGYSYRKKIVIDHTKVSGSTALVNFPVLINIASDNDLRTVANAGDVQNASGYDIMFTSSDGTTNRYHEIEKYTASTGEYVAWVNIPSLSPTTDTVIYMYYGNSSITTDPSSTRTWDGADYKGVWHLNETPTVDTHAYDSTSNANSASFQHMTSGDQVAARIGGGLDFDGIDDFLDIADSASLDVTTAGTIEMWVKLRSTFSGTSGSNMGLMDKGAYQLFLDKSDGKLRLSLHGDTTDAWSTSYDSPAVAIVSLAVYNGKLYAGTGSDGIVYALEGSSWSQSFDAPPSSASVIESLAVYNGKLYAGTFPNGIVYVYDGSSWAVIADLAADTITSLAVYNGKLYAGSTDEYGPNDGIIYVYDGNSWEVSYDWPATNVPCLAVYNGKLFAGASDGIVYVYDGDFWNTSYDESLADVFWALAPYYSSLYAAGSLYTYSGYSAANYIYDGTDWLADGSAYPDGYPPFMSLAVYDGDFYSGTFNDVGSQPDGVVYVYAFGSGSWHLSYDPPEDRISSLAVYNGKLYAGVGAPNGIVYVYGSADDRVLASSTASWDTGWHYVVARSTGTTMHLYVDGVFDSSELASVSIAANIKELLLGKTYGSQMAGGTPEAFDGIMDEVRISSTDRSPEWIATTYNNQSSPSTFYSVGVEQVMAQVENWKSYNTSLYIPANEDDDFSDAEHTVYMHGTSFIPSGQYRVTFYDDAGVVSGDAHKIQSLTAVADGSGELNAECGLSTFQGKADAGTWHAVVSLPSGEPAPDTL